MSFFLVDCDYFLWGYGGGGTLTKCQCCIVNRDNELVTNVDEVDLIMFNSISKSNTKSNKNNLDVVQLAAILEVICIQ